jgi:hypothetical protein
MNRFTTRHAVACYLGFDAAEMEDYRYQPTRTPCPVYAVGNDYFTASKGRAPKPGTFPNPEWSWQKIEEAQFYGSQLGWCIWQHVEPA